MLSKKPKTLDDTVEVAREEELNASIGISTELPVAALDATPLYEGDAWLKDELGKSQQKLVMSLAASAPGSEPPCDSHVQTVRQGSSNHQRVSRS